LYLLLLLTSSVELLFVSSISSGRAWIARSAGQQIMTDAIAVLVVEDEALILMNIVDQLEDEGFRVYQAPNADAAIRLLMLHPDIRLVFTDIDMPGSMDGLKLAAAVRDRWPPVKIIVTSGRVLSSTATLPSGSAFFGKPYNHLSVVRSIRDMLSTGGGVPCRLTKSPHFLPRNCDPTLSMAMA
jgi:CheY-like chemotaxis protein